MFQTERKVAQVHNAVGEADHVFYVAQMVVMSSKSSIIAASCSETSSSCSDKGTPGGGSVALAVRGDRASQAKGHRQFEKS